MEYESKVKECVGDKYSVIGEYKGRTKPILMHCNIHNIDFSVNAECFMRGPDDIRGSCPSCLSENKINKNRVKLQCSYCGEYFFRIKSKLDNSKNGLYFCCRKHKDLAQRLDSGDKFDVFRPLHYGDINSNYRDIAFRNYPNECAVCGYNEDNDISLLEVHHIDEDRSNNEINNLIILCPNCHRKLTSQKYILVDRIKIIKKENNNNNFVI